jgi:hypothetical protein
LKQAKILFSSYRQDQFADEEGFLSSLVMVLAEYPEEVIRHITDPRTGIQRACKWPPTIAEIVTACEVQMQHMEKLKRLANHGKPKVVPMLEAPREERPTLEELKAKYGENYGLELAKPKTKPRPMEVIAMDALAIALEYQNDPSRLARLLRKDGDDA